MLDYSFLKDIYSNNRKIAKKELNIIFKTKINKSILNYFIILIFIELKNINIKKLHTMHKI